MGISRFHLDLHTHSIISHDGGITAEQYRKMHSQNESFCVAITDHNQIFLAQEMNKELGPRIVVGEEIMTAAGEIIGLFLEKLIPAQQSLDETIARIKDQGGLVYVPHPLERIRRGIDWENLEQIKSRIDVIESFNARTLTAGVAVKISAYAEKFRIAQAASSDAHCLAGLGSAYSLVSELPSRDNLVRILSSAQLKKDPASPLSLLCPGYNKLKKYLRL